MTKLSNPKQGPTLCIRVSNSSSHTWAISRNETPRHQKILPTTPEIKIPGEQHTLRPQFPATSLSNVGGWSGNRNSKIRAPWRPVAAFNCTTAGVWAMEWDGWDGMGCKWIEGAARRSTGDDVDAIDAKTLEGGWKRLPGVNTSD